MKSVIIFLLMPAMLFSQHQERKILIYNTGFGGLSAGIGAVINKKKNEEWKHTFVRGFWQGSIGGLLNYAGKKSIYLVNKHNNFGYALPARIVNAAGNSIIQNAALNEPFLQNWNIEYGIFRFDLSLKKEKKLKVRILPVSVLASAVSFSKGRLDVSTSLLTGIMCFKAKELINTSREKSDGINYGRAFIYLDSTTKYHIVSHEIIHEYQYREYLVLNAYWHPLISKMKNNGFKKLFTNYIYADVPYFGLFYMLEGEHQPPAYFRNYFEFEAERCGTNEQVHVE